MSRSVRMGALVGVAVWMLAAAGVVEAASVGRRVVTIPGQVRAFAHGEMTGVGVPTPPLESDLRSMTLSRAAAGEGYIGRLTFAAPEWRRLTTYEGQRATHQVFISLQPPSGARMRVHLNSEGVATLDRASGDAFTRVADAVARVDGASVVFEIAESVGMTPDWEVQGHALVRSAAGTGVHSHTAQVRAGSLTGEDGRIVRLPAAGSRVDAEGVPLLWMPTTPMPAGTRPVSVGAVRRGDDIAFEITMDAPPARATFEGALATSQFIALVIGDPAANAYTILYDVVKDRVIGSAFDGRTGELDRALVEVQGSIVRVLLEEAPLVQALGVLKDAVPVGVLAQSAPATEAPPPPAVGPTTDITVAGFVIGPGGGAAVEGPVVPLGELIPPAPSGGTPIAPIVGGAALALLLAGAIALLLRSRAAGPSVLEEIDPSDAAQKDPCEDLEIEVARLRTDLANARERLRQREAAEAKADTSTEFFGEVLETAGEVRAGLGEDAVEIDRDRVLDEVERRASESDDEHERTGRAKDRVRDLEEGLADAERRLRECRQRTGTTSPPPPSEPSVLDDIDEVPVIS